MFLILQGYVKVIKNIHSRRDAGLSNGQPNTVKPETARRIDKLYGNRYNEIGFL